MKKFCDQLEFQCIPKDLKEEILEYSLSLHAQKIAYHASYGQFEHQDSTSMAYIEDPKKYVRAQGLPRPVCFWRLNNSIRIQLANHFSQNSFCQNLEWYIQFVKGGSFVAPHIDKAAARTKNIFYLIQAGGDNVTTSWWTPKVEFQREIIPETTIIPFEKIELVESHVLQEDRWYQLDVSKIHSVSKHMNHRIGLSAGLL